MERIDRSRLFHRIVSALTFEKRKVGGNLSHAQIYTIAEIICDSICTKSIMVVSATMTGFPHAVLGEFGKDEPWPEWCDPNGLLLDFGISAEDQVACNT